MSNEPFLDRSRHVVIEGIASVKPLIDVDLSDMAIVFLINSPMYFLDWVIVVMDKQSYRLIVSRFGDVVYDRYFGSLEEAKTTFFDNYQFLAFRDSDTPLWSAAYFPMKKWLAGKLAKAAPNII